MAKKTSQPGPADFLYGDSSTLDGAKPPPPVVDEVIGDTVQQMCRENGECAACLHPCPQGEGKAHPAAVKHQRQIDALRNKIVAVLNAESGDDTSNSVMVSALLAAAKDVMVETTRSESPGMKLEYGLSSAMAAMRLRVELAQIAKSKHCQLPSVMVGGLFALDDFLRRITRNLRKVPSPGTTPETDKQG